MQFANSWSRFLLWVLVSLFLATALALVVGQSPPPMRRIGLTYAVYGMVTGFLIGYAAGELSVSRSLAVTILGATSILIGGAQIGWNSFQQLRSQRQAQLAENPEQLAILNMVEKISEGDAELSASYEEERRRLKPHFVDYLRFRYSNIAEVPPFWSWGLWGLELLLAATLGGWMIWTSNSASLPEESTT